MSGSDKALAADKPSVIRIAIPGVGIGNRPVTGGSNLSIVHLKGLLENEFKADGIRIEWTFLRGAGPAVNEVFANGLADFSSLGDLPYIVGQASGLKRKILAASGVRQNTYLAVPSDSDIQSIKDLKGKRIAIFKGTNIQTAVASILEANGLKEKDLKAINMDTATTRAALVTHDIDAAFGGSDLLSLRDQGAVKIVYATKDDPRYLRHGIFIGSDDFIKKYPEITQRVVNQLVIASKWGSDYAGNPAPVYQLWAKSGVQFSNYREDLGSSSLKVLLSPLADPYLVSQLKQKIKDAKRFELIKQEFALEPLVDDHFLKQALKDQALAGYWRPVDVSGNWRVSNNEQPTSAPTAQLTR